MAAARILLVIRQYEGKSYHGMFAADWLIEACYLMRMFINRSKIPHSFYHTIEIRRLNNRYHIGKDSREFHTMLTDVKQVLFLGIDSTAFKPTNQCIPVLYLESQADEEEEVCQTVYWCRHAKKADNLYNKN